MEENKLNTPAEEEAKAEKKNKKEAKPKEKKSFGQWMKQHFSEKAITEFFKSKRSRPLVITVCSLLVLALAFVIYVSTYYRADADAINTYAATYLEEDTNVYFDKSGNIVVAPGDAKAGFIFYPGGKVEYTSYLPLMIALANRGILSVIVEMPYNLAVFDVNAADGITEDFPEIEDWYIGGHSLGGAMAAKYLKENNDKLDGIVLLASYSTDFLADTRAFTLYGTEDKVMNYDKLRQYMVNLPVEAKETLINGGNHAYFGMYGEQRGDGDAWITPTEQINLAARCIADFIFE